jgi:trehalose 6-phosphate phosphatase
VTVPLALADDVSAAEARTGDALALVSGRAIADFDRLFSPLPLRGAGAGGAELRLDPSDEPLPKSDTPASALWTALTEVPSAFPGTFAEHERLGHAVHRRQAAAVCGQAAGACGALRTGLANLLGTQSQPEFTMFTAHCAFELEARRFDKGRAAAAFLSAPPFQGRRPISSGEDHTEAGFAAVSARRGRGYSVGQPRPGAVANASDVRDWLAAHAAGGASA